MNERNVRTVVAFEVCDSMYLHICPKSFVVEERQICDNMEIFRMHQASDTTWSDFTLIRVKQWYSIIC